MLNVGFLIKKTLFFACHIIFLYIYHRDNKRVV